MRVSNVWDEYGMRDKDLVARLQMHHHKQKKVVKTDLKPVKSSSSCWDDLAGVKELSLQREGAGKLGLYSPYFRVQDGQAHAECVIDGRTIINFSNYNYLDLSGHEAISGAAKDAIDRYGTSASASRIVAGERPIHRELETALAAVYQQKDALVYVSGFATNVTTIGHLMGAKDAVFVDSRSHNSVLQGCRLSGAKTLTFPHNDMEELEHLLQKNRRKFSRVLIVVEGLYSMDGDCPDLPAVIDLKKKYKCQLMVDEAHALGVLGETGLGSWEHWDIDPKDVDIWMGTMSKTLASCGGYIVGDSTLIDYLRHSVPGFVYSVGIAPSLAAASLKALEIMKDEKERVKQLQKNGRFFLEKAHELGLDTGLGEGTAITPIMTGSSIKAVKASQSLLEQGVNAMPIIHPAVEAKAARLRFFLSSAHTEAQMTEALEKTKAILDQLQG